MMKKVITLLAAAAATASLAWAGVTYVQLGPYYVEGSHVVDLSAAVTRPFYLTSVVQTFPDRSSGNELEIYYIRAGVTNRILYSLTTNDHSTVIWYLPNKLYLRRSDTLIINNSDDSPAVIDISGEMPN